MKAYERSLFSLDDESPFFDVLGNSASKDELPELSAIFGSKDRTSDIPTHLNYENFSVLINESTETTFESISEAILSNMQKVEVLLYQLLLQRELTQQDYEVLEYYYWLEGLRVDGQISPEKYSKAINGLDANTVDPIIKMVNIQALHNFIYDELFHAQYRMIDGYNSQCSAIKAHTPLLPMGNEIRSFSLYADNTAFCYQDSLKAIFKVLDIFSKWFSYISCYKSLKKKVPQSYFSDFLAKLKEMDESTLKHRAEKICKPLAVFTFIRNEITHNESMQRNRQILFIGRGTSEVSEKNLFYSKMLFWDHDEHSLSRASGSLGFFTQNLDTLVETRNYFVATVKLVTTFMEHFFYEIINELVGQGVEHPFVWVGAPDTLRSFSIEDIKKRYNHFTMLE